MQMNSITIEDIYQEILDGKRNRFPPNTWKLDRNNEMARRVTSYLVTKILNWNKEEIKQNWNNKLIAKYRLRGVLKNIYENSPYAMINDLYPNQFKEWEFKMTPSGFWTREKALDALRWTIEEKEKLTDNQLLQQYTMNWLKSHRLWTPVVRYWNGSPYAMINDLYPNKYIKSSFRGYINKV
ncbi:hypothetical protein MC28_F105 (plasmid) [Bacillus thuringiensis MC28]|nr:hypothetical protein MC28_F105 [Bacillus thuringiensis MC28]